jgi:type I restriction enzyme S subunit
LTHAQVLLGDVLKSHRSGFWGDESGTRDVDVRAIRNGDIHPTGCVRWKRLPLRGFTRRELEAAQVQPGDLLLTTSGNCGHVALVRRQPDRLTCATNFVRILRPDPSRIDPLYLFHFLNRASFRQSLTPFIRGTAIKNLSVRDVLGQSRIPLPSMPQQQQIADVLDRAGALCAKRRKSGDLLEQLARAVFVSFFGDPRENPKGWPERPLGGLAQLYGGASLLEFKDSSQHLDLIGVSWQDVDDRDCRGSWSGSSGGRSPSG